MARLRRMVNVETELLRGRFSNIESYWHTYITPGVNSSRAGRRKANRMFHIVQASIPSLHGRHLWVLRCRLLKPGRSPPRRRQRRTLVRQACKEPTQLRTLIISTMTPVDRAPHIRGLPVPKSGTVYTIGDLPMINSRIQWAPTFSWATGIGRCDIQPVLQCPPSTLPFQSMTPLPFAPPMP
jgi:hypothetical protein